LTRCGFLWLEFNGYVRGKLTQAIGSVFAENGDLNRRFDVDRSVILAKGTVFEGAVPGGDQDAQGNVAADEATILHEQRTLLGDGACILAVGQIGEFDFIEGAPDGMVADIGGVPVPKEVAADVAVLELPAGGLLTSTPAISFAELGPVENAVDEMPVSCEASGK